jgi:TRAP-type C4-dicarboxylate transport system permease small subunit
MLDRFLETTSRIMLVIAAIIGFSLSFIVVIDVVGRVAFNTPFKGTPELVSSAIVIICWLQAAFAIRSGGMINVDAFTSIMPYRAQSLLGIIGSLLGAGLFGLICYASVEHAAYAWTSGEYDGEGALRVPAWPARFIMLIGTGLGAVSYALLALRQAQAFARGDPPIIASSSHAT